MIFSDAGPDGTCVIAIQDDTVRVTESNCPQNICIRQGIISKPGDWLACVPHKVFVQIVGNQSTGPDEVSY